jgi:cytochrome c biogenesis factor
MAGIAIWGTMIDVIVSYTGYRIIISTEFYNSLFYPFILALSYLTGVCMLYGKVKSRTLGYAASGYLTLSIVISIAIPGNSHSIVPQEFVNFNFFEGALGSVSIISYLPAFFFVTASIAWKAVRDLKFKSTTAVMHLTGINIIHIGFIFVVMGAAISCSFSSNHVFMFSLDEKGVYKEYGGVGIRFLDYSVEKKGNDWEQIVDIELNYGKKSNTSALFMKSTKFGYISHPAVSHGLFSDVTVDLQGSIPHQIQSERIELNVKKQPFISILWAGCVMLLAGVVFTFSSDYMRRRTRNL